MNRRFTLSSTLVALLMFATSVFAGWPERPIRLVVPYSGGAMGDTLARLIADDLSDRFGQPVIVDNRPGAGGNVGAAAVAQAPPDGYTLLVGASNNFVINQYLYRSLKFDPLKASSRSPSSLTCRRSSLSTQGSQRSRSPSSWRTRRRIRTS